jgi:hypothetical protein
LTHGGNSGVEYFEIIPSVKAMTARSLGTFSPIFVGGFNGYGKSSFTAKTASMALSSNFPIIISQVSMSSIFMMRFSLKVSLTNNALIYRPSSLPTLT